MTNQFFQNLERYNRHRIKNFVLLPNFMTEEGLYLVELFRNYSNCLYLKHISPVCNTNKETSELRLNHGRTVTDIYFWDRPFCFRTNRLYFHCILCLPFSIFSRTDLEVTIIHTINSVSRTRTYSLSVYIIRVYNIWIMYVRVMKGSVDV